MQHDLQSRISLYPERIQHSSLGAHHINRLQDYAVFRELTVTELCGVLVMQNMCKFSVMFSVF